MRQAEAYAQLRDLGGSVVGTREAAALWHSEEGTARRRLQSLAEAGLVTPIRRGLWSVEPDLGPFAVAPYLTAPFPAYASTFSAFAAHGMIDQIPGRVSVVSLDRARRIQTSIGAFDVHHIAPSFSEGLSRGGVEDRSPARRRPCSTSSTYGPPREVAPIYPSSPCPTSSTTMPWAPGSTASGASGCARSSVDA
jgi:hypothetical protein